MNDSIKKRIAQAEGLISEGAPVRRALRMAKLSQLTWYAYKRKQAPIEPPQQPPLPPPHLPCDPPSIGMTLLNQFEQAARHDEMKGACRPEEALLIERRYQVSRELLLAYLNVLSL